MANTRDRIPPTVAIDSRAIASLRVNSPAASVTEAPGQCCYYHSQLAYILPAGFMALSPGNQPALLPLSAGWPGPRACKCKIWFRVSLGRKRREADRSDKSNAPEFGDLGIGDSQCRCQCGALSRCAARRAQHYRETLCRPRQEYSSISKNPLTSCGAALDHRYRQWKKAERRFIVCRIRTAAGSLAIHSQQGQHRPAGASYLTTQWRFPSESVYTKSSDYPGIQAVR